MRHTLLRGVLVIALLLFGAVMGLATVLEHQRTWTAVLAVAAVLASTIALPPGWSTRLPFALGLAVVFGLAILPLRTGGDLLVPANARGYVLLGLGFVVVLTSVTTLPRPGRLPRMPE